MHGGLVSVYDGQTQYKLGSTLHARRGGAAWPPLDACYFAHPNMQQVRKALVTHCYTVELQLWPFLDLPLGPVEVCNLLCYSLDIRHTCSMQCHATTDSCIARYLRSVLQVGKYDEGCMITF